MDFIKDIGHRIVESTAVVYYIETVHGSYRLIIMLEKCLFKTIVILQVYLIGSEPL